MENDIAILRQQLYEMVERGELGSPEILELSQQLDILILEYYKNKKSVA